MALDGLGRHDDAIAAAKEATRLRPELAEARSMLGSVLSHAGRTEEAKAAYREALRIDPELFTARNNLASQLQYEGRLDEAIAEFPRLDRPRTASGGLALQPGNALSAHKDYAARPRSCAQACRLEPDSIEAFVNLGCVQCESGAIDAGITTLRDATRRRSGHVKAWVNLAKALKAKGDIDGLRELARQKPELAPVSIQLGKAILDRGRYEEALGPLAKAVELDPNNYSAVSALGICQSRLGRHDEAIATLTRAARLAPNDAVAQRNLGGALYSRGDHDAAIAAYRLSLRLKADDPYTHADLERPPDQGRPRRGQGSL